MFGLTRVGPKTILEALQCTQESPVNAHHEIVKGQKLMEDWVMMVMEVLSQASAPHCWM